MASLTLFTEVLDRPSNPSSPPSVHPRPAEETSIPVDPTSGRPNSDFSHFTPPNSAVDGHSAPYAALTEYASSQHVYDYAPPPMNPGPCNKFRVHGQEMQDSRQNAYNIYDAINAQSKQPVSAICQSYQDHLQFAEEPPQNKPSVLDDLFGDTDKPEIIAEDFDNAALGVQVLDEVHDGVPNTQTSESQPEHQNTDLFRYPTSFHSDPQGTLPVDDWGDHLKEDHSYDSVRSLIRQRSPTESELVADGFEFHNELPEDVQINYFNDKAFRKALREVKPDLLRKQQWYAWDKVRQMMYGETVISAQGLSLVYPLEYKGEIDIMLRHHPGESIGNVDAEDGTLSQGESHSPDYSPREMPVDLEQLESRWNVLKYAPQPVTDLNYEIVTQISQYQEPESLTHVDLRTKDEKLTQINHPHDQSQWSAHQPQADTTSSPASANEGPGPGCDCACNECQRPCPADACRGARNETPMLEPTRSQSVDRLSEHTHRWLIGKVAGSHHAIRQASIISDDPAIKEGVGSEKEPVVRSIGEVATNSSQAAAYHRAVPIPAPSIRASRSLRSYQTISGIDRPDTPRPLASFDDSIRQSVEPETPLHTRHRKSTPAFESRSLSPSPVSNSGRTVDVDIDMPEADDSPSPPMPAIPRTRLPQSSPDPLSSPVQHAVTVTETPVPISSPLRQTQVKSQTRSRRSLSPSKPPMPPFPVLTASGMAKPANRGNKSGRKSVVAGSGVEKGPAANKGRNVTRKVMESVEKAVKATTAGGKEKEEMRNLTVKVKRGKVAEAVKNIEKGLSGELRAGSPPRRSRRIEAKK